ncbi:MAG: sodium:solute symporter [Acutalibacteraceae bacterium]
MNSTQVICTIMLVAFFAVMIGIGVYCRKKANSVTGFVLGGRSVGPWLTAFAFGTSYFSAVIFVGYAGQFGWKFGVASTWIGLGNAFIGSLLAWSILGRRTRIMTQHLGAKTMPEFFGIRYDSKALKIASSVIVFIFLIPYTASLYNGLARLFAMAFNIPYYWCVIGMAIITCIYVVVGGYMATAINDFIQGIIMIGGIMVVIYAVLKNQGGFSEAMTKLSEIPAENSAMSGAFTSFFGPDALSLLFVVILTSLGTWGLPQMVQKFYAIKSESDISKGTIISTLFAIIVAGGCYFLGGFGRLFTPETKPDGTIVYDSIIPNMLQNSSLSAVIIAIVIVLVLSASMSTLSSLVLASSSTLTIDFIKPLKKKEMSENSQVVIMRLLIVVFVAVSAIIAIVQANSSVTFIAQLMGISWGALAGAFLGPFMWGLYLKKITKSSVWFSFIVGAGIMVCDLYCNLTGKVFISTFFSSPINCGVLAMAISLVATPLISLITPKLKKEKVEEMFSCFKRKVLVEAKDALSDGEE